LSLYRGELLEGLDVGSAEFEDWLRGQRERTFEVAVQVGGQLLAHQTRGGRLEAAVQTAVRLLALEPAEEPVHRALMRLYARLGFVHVPELDFEPAPGLTVRGFRLTLEP